MDDPQQLVQCPYCVSEVKANRLSIHIGKVHKNITGKEQCLLHTDHKVDDMESHLSGNCGAMDELIKNHCDAGGVSTVPAPVPCVIDYGPNAENWDNSNYPSYKPLEVTEDKIIIRGSYASGLQPAQKKHVVEEERARRAELSERQNRTNYNQSNNFNNFAQRNGPNNRPVVGNQPIGGNLSRPHSNNFRATDSDSNFSSVSAQPLRDVTEGSNNDRTTDSDGFVAVTYSRRNNSTISRGRGRGRYHQN